MKTGKFMARQGDLLIREIADGEAPAEALEAAPKDPRGLVLAEGESSGHFHSLVGRGCKLFNFREGGLSARVVTTGKAGAEVVVIGGESAPGFPRHTPVRLPGGKRFEIRTQRTWDAAAELKSRAVAD